MLRIEIKNLNDIEEVFYPSIKNIIREKENYFAKLFKKYSKDLLLTVTFNKDNEYRVSVEINMQSKHIRIVKTDKKDPLAALQQAFSDFKKAVKKQIHIERKDYLYKRKRYRQQKWADNFAEITEEIASQKEGKSGKHTKKLKNALKSVQKYLKTRLKSFGLTKKEVKAVLPVLIEKVERRFYREFDPDKNRPEEMENFLFGIAEEILTSEFKVETSVPAEEFNDEETGIPEPDFDVETIMLEDITDNETVLDKAYAMDDEEVESKLQFVIQSGGKDKQAVYHLHYIEQFTADEISRTLHMDKNEVNQALQDLKSEVEKVFAPSGDDK